MSNVALAQPHSVSAAIITCSLFGTSGTKFYVKVGRARISSRTGPVIETTGDGDDAPALETGYWQYTNLALAGWMPSAANADTLTNLTATNTQIVAASQQNPIPATLKLSLSSNHHLNFASGTALITSWDWEYSREQAVIPVFINIRATYSLATWSST